MVASKLYGLKFGANKANAYTGLSPSFTIFRINGVSAVASPGITETPASSGLYQFSFGPTTQIFFEVDGSASITSVSDRYIYGLLDPLQLLDQVGTTLLAMGTTNVALGTTSVALGTTAVAIGTTILAASNQYGTSLVGILGNTSSSFGTTNTDPSTVFGMLKRLQEFNEGNATYTKSSQSWQIFSRGSSTLLQVKTLTNNTTQATKS